MLDSIFMVLLRNSHNKKCWTYVPVCRDTSILSSTRLSCRHFVPQPRLTESDRLNSKHQVGCTILVSFVSQVFHDTCTSVLFQEAHLAMRDTVWKESPDVVCPMVAFGQMNSQLLKRRPNIAAYIANVLLLAWLVMRERETERTIAAGLSNTCTYGVNTRLALVPEGMHPLDHRHTAHATALVTA